MTAPQPEHAIRKTRPPLKWIRGRLFCPVGEAAELLEVDPRTLRRAIDAGEFPAVKVGSSWRIPVARLLALAGLDDEPADQPGAPAAPIVLDGAHRGPRIAS